jgi:hypothetical protein
LDSKQNIDRQVATETINSNAIIVKDHCANALMGTLEIVPKTRYSKITGDNTTKGVSVEKENVFEI